MNDDLEIHQLVENLGSLINDLIQASHTNGKSALVEFTSRLRPGDAPEGSDFEMGLRALIGGLMFHMQETVAKLQMQEHLTVPPAEA